MTVNWSTVCFDDFKKEVTKEEPSETITDHYYKESTGDGTNRTLVKKEERLLKKSYRKAEIVITFKKNN